MTVPIWFSLTSSALPTPSAMPRLQNLRVGDEDIVADELDAGAELARQQLPAFPVAFRDAVLDRRDRVLAQPVFKEPDHLFRGAVRLARFLEDVLAAAGPQLARCDVERDEDVLARLHAALGDGLEHDFDRFAIGPQVRREAAFVADAGRLTLRLQDAAQRVEDLRAGAQRFGERRGADRHHHELLEVDARVRVRAAVEDVHHRHRQERRRSRRAPGRRRGRRCADRAAAGSRRLPREGPPSRRRAARWRRGGSWSPCRRGRSSPRPDRVA